jgi:hypothetical protein
MKKHNHVNNKCTIEGEKEKKRKNRLNIIVIFFELFVARVNKFYLLNSSFHVLIDLLYYVVLQF